MDRIVDRKRLASTTSVLTHVQLPTPADRTVNARPSITVRFRNFIEDF